ncbi:fasciclin domain-containing protein [Rhodohalobacter sp. 614A]|uniref:fasciclin domain-containing protein n=1 Tax=Rhodohalobacter sp. 614A TaxID=2908649 RepID=UPI001F34BC88|nr:fasciclin domain-containing protein [Rhodohalobacter sp. 614A]
MFNKKRLSVITSLFVSLFLFAGISNLQAQDNTIIEVINNSENHTVFANLLNETGLSDVVSQEGPYTVVAPTDQAFENMDANLEELKANPDSLQSVVISHLFKGEVTASNAESSLGVEITEGDIPASNGVVHISSDVIEE